MLQVAVEATAGKRKKRRSKSVAPPIFLLFTGGAWTDAPPVPQLLPPVFLAYDTVPEALCVFFPYIYVFIGIFIVV